MLKLEAQKRDTFGKKLSRERAVGRLPVIIYGRQKESLPLFVDTKAFHKIFSQAGESSIITLKIPEGEESVLINDVTYHPVTDEPIHADFYVVEKDKKIEVTVPIEFTGVPPAVKDFGGTLVKVLHELDIESLPQDLPREIVVDLNILTALDSQISIRDLELPKGVNVLNDPSGVVASIAVTEEEVEEEVAPDLSAIEVEKRGKEEKAGDEAPDPAKKDSA